MVQVESRKIEAQVRSGLTSSGIQIATGKRVTARYDDCDPLARLQVDAIIPDPENPETLISITYTNPDKPGHSNENKLHLKLGELCFQDLQPKHSWYW